MNRPDAPDRRALLELELQRRRARAAAGPVPRDRSQPAPLSFSQLRLWFLHQFDPTAPTFNAVRAFRLRGAVDAAALRAALDTVVERHESLRTVFAAPGGGEPHQVVLDHEPLPLGEVDLSAVPAAGREAELDRRLRELAREPFDLGADRMLRATLLRLGADDHALLLRMHHIAGDAASMAVLFGELGPLYDGHRAGRPVTLPPPALQFADFAVWQRRRLAGPVLEELTAYWVRRLEGAPSRLALPTDRPRPAVARHEGSHRPFSLSPDLRAGLEALAQEERGTFYMVALAGFATLLYRLSGEADVVVGSPFANRTHAELAGVIGFLSNTVALRIDVAGNPSFREVVRRTREVVLGALQAQEMPFEQVVAALKVPRDAGHNPIFQVNFRAQASEPPAPRLDGLEVQPIPVDIGYSRFDLALELQAGARGLTGYLEHADHLFMPATADRIVAAYTTVLEQGVAEPDGAVLSIALPKPPRRRAAERGPGRRRPVEPA